MKLDKEVNCMQKLRWTDEEIALLRENYQSNRVLIEKIPSRTIRATMQKRYRLGLRINGKGSWFNCVVCGKEIYKPHSQGGCINHFCSNKCRYEFLRQNSKKNPNWRGGRVVLNCCFCGKEFYRFPAELHGGNYFCSKDCHHKSMEITLVSVICDFCGKSFDRKPSAIGRRNCKNNFCSRECSQRFMVGSNNPAWTGGTSHFRYNPDFQRVAKVIRERDEHVCQWSGEYGNSVHHIDGDHKNDECWNLITLTQSWNTKERYHREFFMAYFYCIVKDSPPLDVLSDALGLDLNQFISADEVRPLKCSGEEYE